MYSPAFEFDTRSLDEIGDRAHASPRLMRTALKRQEGRLRTRALKHFRRKPGKVKRPIQWQSEKQRRAFFATDGFGHGIPTIRTDRLINSFDARFDLTEYGGAFAITNDDPKLPFVIGKWQQRMHKATGWYNLDREVDAFVPVVLDVYAQTWLTVADPTAGVNG